MMFRISCRGPTRVIRDRAAKLVQSRSRPLYFKTACLFPKLHVGIERGEVELLLKAHHALLDLIAVMEYPHMSRESDHLQY
jgi:hypothetical protein